jgi:hypothetical protein
LEGQMACKRKQEREAGNGIGNSYYAPHLLAGL